MQSKSKKVNIRFASSRARIASRAGHRVRTPTESAVCDWLAGEGLAHRHGEEIFIVKSMNNRSPLLFVPDIILSEHLRKEGKPIVIETLHTFSPKHGGLRSFAAFCRQYRDQYFTILVAGKSKLASVPRRTCDVQVALESLSTLKAVLS